MDVCFHLLNKNQNSIVDFQQSKSILLDILNIQVVFESFSIQGIEVHYFWNIFRKVCSDY